MIPSAPPSGVGIAGFWFGASEATAPTRANRGFAVVDGVRYSVTRSWYDVSGWSFAKKVSIETVPFASPCAPTDVRRIVSSPYAQRPSTYHFVVVALLITPRISTCSQVPGGVSAFHDETSSVNERPGLNACDVQVPATAAMSPERGSV